MNPNIGRLLILAGIILIATGVLFVYLPRNISIGRLPGDIFIKRKNFTFSFPIATSVLLSLLLSLVFYLVRYFRK